ncbi:hypothetical protein [Chitinophaga niastensis]|uniref:hypothetical protein n=1 Tax=Chitinophaga niastensis TaxID=536980 RepID=UPI000D0CB422|nr:hypothetical protein [Chitinophaga niastensis]
MAIQTYRFKETGLLIGKLNNDDSILLRAEYFADHKVYISPDLYTGKILQQYPHTGRLTGFAPYLHFALLSGKTEATIVLIMGILLFL